MFAGSATRATVPVRGIAAVNHKPTRIRRSRELVTAVVVRTDVESHRLTTNVLGPRVSYSECPARAPPLRFRVRRSIRRGRVGLVRSDRRAMAVSTTGDARRVFGARAFVTNTPVSSQRGGGRRRFPRRKGTAVGPRFRHRLRVPGGVWGLRGTAVALAQRPAGPTHVHI